MTEAEALRVVAMIVNHYPKLQAAGPGPVRSFAKVIEPIPYDIGIATAEAIMRSDRGFPPTTGDFWRIAADIHGGPVRPGAEAWGDVLLAVRRFGAYRAPRFHDPLVAKCVDSLGWREVCLAREDDVSYRSQFIRLYDSLASTERSTAMASGMLPPRPEDGSQRLLGPAINEDEHANPVDKGLALPEPLAGMVKPVP